MAKHKGESPRVRSLLGFPASCYLTEERIPGHQRPLAEHTDKKDWNQTFIEYFVLNRTYM